MKNKSIKVSLLSTIILLGMLYPTITVNSEQQIVKTEDIMEPLVIEEPIPVTVQEEVTVEVIEEAPTNRWNIELTDDEIDMLANIMFLEAHLESEDGISAAIEVVFNRMVSDNFPDTLEDVLSQSNPVQFTSWKNLDIAKPTVKEYSMIYAALNGEKEVLTTEYVYFGRGKQNNNDPIKIWNHWFCKEYKYE